MATTPEVEFGAQLDRYPPPERLLAELVERSEAGAPIEELARLACGQLSALLATGASADADRDWRCCVSVLEHRAGGLAPLGWWGMNGPPQGVTVEGDDAAGAVVLAEDVAATAGVGRRSTASATVWVRGRARAVLAVHAPSGAAAQDRATEWTKVVAYLLGSSWEARLHDADLEQLSGGDSLTGLPTRATLTHRLDEVLRRGQRARALDALICLEVERLTEIGELFGRAQRDRVLGELAARLRRAVRSGDSLAGAADRLLVLCRGLPNTAAALAQAERLRASMSGVVRLGGRDVVLTVAAGVSVARPSADPEGLIGEAELALHKARKQGRGQVAAFDEAFRDQFVERFRMEGELREAIQAGGLTLHYQAVVSLEGLGLRSLEALVRWPHHERGMIFPDEFIPVAENCGLIVELGSWVLDHACVQARRWLDEGLMDGASVSVNLSSHEISDPSLVRRVGAALDGAGLAPERLTLEITESAVVADPESAITALRTVKDLGVGLAIDDFGTGYSSLSYLKRFPVDTIKIDRSFVAGLGSDPDDEIIVRSTVRLAEALGLDTVAEGVETQLQAAELHRLGCIYAQGHFFSFPVPHEEVTLALRSLAY